MRRPRPAPRLLSRTTLLVRVAAGAFAAACAALVACSGSDGQTPACTPNVTANGIQNIADGCEQFSPCLGADGSALMDPAAVQATCCADAGDVASCLYAYGVGPAPSGAGGSSSSGGTGGSDGG